MSNPGPDKDTIAKTLAHFRKPSDRTMSNVASRAAAASEDRVQVEKIKDKIIMGIHREAQKILLDMELPNGKPLRDCTGKECAKLGLWLTKIAGQMKPNEIIGEVLSEDQMVRKL